MTAPRTLELTSPVQYGRQRVERLTIRSCVGGDLDVAGLPITFDGAGGYNVNPPNISRLIARLAGVRLGVIARLTAPDWFAAMALAIEGLAPPVPPPPVTRPRRPRRPRGHLRRVP